VTTQPTLVVKGKSKKLQFGVGAIAFAAVSTFCMFFGLCWWALPCAILGIILGVTVSLFVCFCFVLRLQGFFCQLCYVALIFTSGFVPVAM